MLLLLFDMLKIATKYMCICARNVNKRQILSTCAAVAFIVALRWLPSVSIQLNVFRFVITMQLNSVLFLAIFLTKYSHALYRHMCMYMCVCCCTCVFYFIRCVNLPRLCHILMPNMQKQGVSSRVD